MLCDKCQKAEATVHLSRVVGPDVKKMHLCEACASASGIDLNLPPAAVIEGLLLGLGKAAAAAGGEGLPDPACPSCGLKASEFRSAGRLGCAACYRAFADELAPLLRSLHRGERHAGKAPRRSAGALLDAASADLRRELDEAVAREDFERAAELRDRLRALTARGEKPPP